MDRESAMDRQCEANTVWRPLRHACCVLLLSPATAFCQAGPPLITNDPGTPGNGHLEINLAASGSRSGATLLLSAPDVDINYGLGERIQLSLHAPWAHARAPGESWSSGLGAVEIAVRWRFIDEDRAGFAMAIQPHWASSWSSAAVRRGLAPSGDELSLPLQVSKGFGPVTVGAELARNFIERAPDEWQAGLFVAHDCSKRLQCLAEINTVKPDGENAETVLNIGLRRPLSEHLVLMGSIGHQFGGSQPLVFYLGVQLLR